MNIVGEDNRSRPQGHVVEQVDEDRRHKWQHLRSSTDVQCIDVSQTPIQQTNGRRTRTRNPAARRHPEGGVSSSSRAQLQTGDSSQGGDDRRNV
jgi:hypothetical protein